MASAGSRDDRRRLVRVCRGTYEDAVALQEQLRAELDHDDAIAAGDSLLALCRRYADDRERLGRAASYVVEMRRKCDLLATIDLGARPAAEVTAGDLGTPSMAASTATGSGASGIRAWHATLLSGALSAGVRWGELDRNVAQAASAPAPPRPTGEAPDPDMARRYLDAVEGASPTLGALLRLAGLTGARRAANCAPCAGRTSMPGGAATHNRAQPDQPQG